MIDLDQIARAIRAGLLIAPELVVIFATDCCWHKEAAIMWHVGG